jgi:hypothetical protein
MDKQLKISMNPNPFGRDLLPFDLDIDTAWLQQEMAVTGKTAGEVIADHLGDAIKRDIQHASDINRQYSALNRGGVK